MSAFKGAIQITEHQAVWQVKSASHTA
jgi:hypothetical protein